LGLLCGTIALLPALEHPAQAQPAAAPAAPAAAPAPRPAAPAPQAPAGAATAAPAPQGYPPPPAYPPPAGYPPPGSYPPPGAYPPGYPPPYGYGHQLDIGSVMAQATEDAEADSNGVAWFFIGCLGLLGILIAYVAEPVPPPQRLMGKSPEYVNAYVGAYKAAGKSAQGKQAIIGCLVGTGIAVVFYVILIAALADQNYNNY
jgi:hypothetical protein